MQKLRQFTTTPIFWIAQIIAFLVCTFLAVHYYPKAFPIVDLQIKMDRIGALKSAFDLACQQQWGPTGFRQATNFDLDEQTQTFVELSAGGSKAFTRVLKEGLYSPYTWRVRHFAEGKPDETLIRFTPEGKFYGFREHLAEDAPGKSLSVQEAQKIAENSANRTWSVSLSAFQLVEKSQEKRPGGRVDHTFVYERPRESIGEGRYRLKLVVSGDRLTELTHFIKIPDAFSRHYAEMRSSNDTIASIASVAMAVLYLFIGCGLGIFFLARKRWVIWKAPVLFAGIVAAFQLLEHINQLPLAWMSYNTALSTTGFLLQNLQSFFVSFLADFFLLSISFMAAESLTRKAFPQHPQLWRVWLPGNANSLSILGRTVGGYLSVGFFFSFVVFIYILGTNFFGWWSPSDTLFHPDGLATYSPWFTSISNSLHAGFWEEALFRAVPLAGAALLGERYGHRRSWIIAAFLIQALIFAGAHANYPAQPSYARVLELIIPSFIFGGIYLAFGLLPGIILHFTFDVISFSVPIFTTSSPRVWIDRALVILVCLVPLWIVLAFRLRAGQWTELKNKEFNQGWRPQKSKDAPVEELKPKKAPPIELGWLATSILSVAGLISLISWIFFFNFKNHALPLEVERKQAIQISRAALEKTGIQLSPSWEALASTHSALAEEDQFIWRTEGNEGYRKLIGNYLAPPSWVVRFVRFDTNVEERAEEYQVFISNKGEVLRIRHELPEARKGESLDQADARRLALTAVEKEYGLNAQSLKEVSSNASKLPFRKDWLFIFSDPAIRLKSGEARIGVRIAGDQAVSSRRFVFVPEAWSRTERNRESIIGLIRVFSVLIIAITFLTGIIYSLVNWTQKKFETKDFQKAFALFSTVGLIDLLNTLPSRFAHFSTQAPRVNQMVNLIAFSFVKILFLSTCTALLIGYFHYHARRRLIVSKPTVTLAGYSLGIIILVVTGLISRTLPVLSPTWGSLAGLDHTIPALMGLQTFEKYVLVTLVFALLGLIIEKVTQNWSQREHRGTFFLFLFGFAISGLPTEDTLGWIVLGTTVGTCLYVTYRLFIQANISLIPLATGSVIALLEIKQIVMRPYPGIQLNAAVAIALVLGASYYWHKKLSFHSMQKPH